MLLQKYNVSDNYIYYNNYYMYLHFHISLLLRLRKKYVTDIYKTLRFRVPRGLHYTKYKISSSVH